MAQQAALQLLEITFICCTGALQVGLEQKYKGIGTQKAVLDGVLTSGYEMDDPINTITPWGC